MSKTFISKVFIQWHNCPNILEVIMAVCGFEENNKK